MSHGVDWSRSSSKRLIRWAGSIIVGCLSRSEISPQSNNRYYTISTKKLRPWGPDSINQAAEKPGAIQLLERHLKGLISSGCKLTLSSIDSGSALFFIIVASEKGMATVFALWHKRFSACRLWDRTFIEALSSTRNCHSAKMQPTNFSKAFDTIGVS